MRPPSSKEKVVYRCKYFEPHELVGPTLYNNWAKTGGDVERIFTIFDEQLLRFIDLFRETYGPCVINNWRSGGPRQESGLRSQDTSTGALLSMHKYGKAVDIIPSQLTPEEIRKQMQALGCFNPGFKHRTDLNSKGKMFSLINRIEWMSQGKPITWFHCDMSTWGPDDGSIKIVNV